MTNATITPKTSNSATPRGEIYYFASSSSRIFARLFDAILLCLFYTIFAFFYYFLCNPNQSVIKNMTNTTWWQLDLYILLVFVVNFSYFVLLPYFWKGQTFFTRIFKIRIIVATEKNCFWKLIYRELFVWMGFSILFWLVLLTLTVCYPNSPINKLIWQVTTQDPKATLGVQIISWAFKILAICLMLIGLFILINTIFNSHYQTIYDLKTHTAVVMVKKPINQPKQKTTIKPEPTKVVDLPGRIIGERLVDFD